MGWVEDVARAIGFIEEHLAEELRVEDVAGAAYLSPFYFQKGFAMLCGLTVGEYVRRRRLSLAAGELAATDAKVIDVALKYGYDSPDSFAKAFTRFHGATPTAVRKDGASARTFTPLRIKLTLEGGSMLEHRIAEKEAFTITGLARQFHYDSAFRDIPRFWEEFNATENAGKVCGMYGVSVEDNPAPGVFTYLIADNYKPWEDVPEGFVTKVIPRHTWAVFPCRGPLPGSLQDVNRRIFAEWLPDSREWEIAEGVNVEMYSDPAGFPNGMEDAKYTSEIWIPVRKKQAD